jgi:hypothetical protein
MHSPVWRRADAARVRRQKRRVSAGERDAEVTQRAKVLAALLAGALCSTAASGCNDYGEQPRQSAPAQRDESVPQNRSSQPLSSPREEPESFEA